MKVGDLVRDIHKKDIGVIIEIDGEAEQHRVYRVCFVTFISVHLFIVRQSVIGIPLSVTVCHTLVINDILSYTILFLKEIK